MEMHHFEKPILRARAMVRGATRLLRWRGSDPDACEVAWQGLAHAGLLVGAMLDLQMPGYLGGQGALALERAEEALFGCEGLLVGPPSRPLAEALEVLARIEQDLERARRALHLAGTQPRPLCVANAPSPFARQSLNL